MTHVVRERKGEGERLRWRGRERETSPPQEIMDIMQTHESEIK